MPARPAFNSTDLEGGVVGDLVGRIAAVDRQGQRGRCGRGRVQGEAELVAVGTDVAGGIGLTYQHVLGTITAATAIGGAGKAETGGNAVLPGRTVVQAVLPAGTSLQLADVDRTFIGDPVTGIATVLGQRQGGLGRQRSIERKADRIADGTDIAGNIGLAYDHLLGPVGIAGAVRCPLDLDAAAAAIAPGHATVQTVLPAGTALDSADVERAIVGQPVEAAAAGIVCQSGAQLGGRCRIQGHRQHLLCTVIAGAVGLAHLDGVRTIACNGEAAPATRLIVTAIDLVGPAGSGFQSGDQYLADAGDAVTRDTGIAGQCQRRSEHGRRGIDRDAMRYPDGVQSLDGVVRLDADDLFHTIGTIRSQCLPVARREREAPVPHAGAGARVVRGDSALDDATIGIEQRHRVILAGGTGQGDACSALGQIDDVVTGDRIDGRHVGHRKDGVGQLGPGVDAAAIVGLPCQLCLYLGQIAGIDTGNLECREVLRRHRPAIVTLHGKARLDGQIGQCADLGGRTDFGGGAAVDDGAEQLDDIGTRANRAAVEREDAREIHPDTLKIALLRQLAVPRIAGHAIGLCQQARVTVDQRLNARHRTDARPIHSGRRQGGDDVFLVGIGTDLDDAGHAQGLEIRHGGGIAGVAVGIGHDAVDGRAGSMGHALQLGHRIDIRLRARLQGGHHRIAFHGRQSIDAEHLEVGRTEGIGRRDHITGLLRGDRQHLVGHACQGTQAGGAVHSRRIGRTIDQLVQQQQVGRVRQLVGEGIVQTHADIVLGDRQIGRSGAEAAIGQGQQLGVAVDDTLHQIGPARLVGSDRAGSQRLVGRGEDAVSHSLGRGWQQHAHVGVVLRHGHGAGVVAGIVTDLVLCRHGLVDQALQSRQGIDARQLVGRQLLQLGQYGRHVLVAESGHAQSFKVGARRSAASHGGRAIQHQCDGIGQGQYFGGGIDLLGLAPIDHRVEQRQIIALGAGPTHAGQVGTQQAVILQGGRGCRHIGHAIGQAQQLAGAVHDTLHQFGRRRARAVDGTGGQRREDGKQALGHGIRTVRCGAGVLAHAHHAHVSKVLRHRGDAVRTGLGHGTRTLALGIGHDLGLGRTGGRTDGLQFSQGIDIGRRTGLQGGHEGRQRGSIDVGVGTGTAQSESGQFGHRDSGGCVLRLHIGIGLPHHAIDDVHQVQCIDLAQLGHRGEIGPSIEHFVEQLDVGRPIVHGHAQGTEFVHGQRRTRLRGAIGIDRIGRRPVGVGQDAAGRRQIAQLGSRRGHGLDLRQVETGQSIGRDGLEAGVDQSQGGGRSAVDLGHQVLHAQRLQIARGGCGRPCTTGGIRHHPAGKRCQVTNLGRRRDGALVSRLRIERAGEHIEGSLRPRGIGGRQTRCCRVRQTVGRHADAQQFFAGDGRSQIAGHAIGGLQHMLVSVDDGLQLALAVHQAGVGQYLDGGIDAGKCIGTDATHAGTCIVVHRGRQHAVHRAQRRVGIVQAVGIVADDLQVLQQAIHQALQAGAAVDPVDVTTGHQRLHVGQEGRIEPLHAQVAEIIEAQSGRSSRVAGGSDHLAGRCTDHIDACGRGDLVAVQGIQRGGQQADSVAVGGRAHADADAFQFGLGRHCRRADRIGRGTRAVGGGQDLQVGAGNGLHQRLGAGANAVHDRRRQGRIDGRHAAAGHAVDAHGRVIVGGGYTQRGASVVLGVGTDLGQGIDRLLRQRRDCGQRLDLAAVGPAGADGRQDGALLRGIPAADIHPQQLQIGRARRSCAWQARGAVHELVDYVQQCLQLVQRIDAGQRHAIDGTAQQCCTRAIRVGRSSGMPEVQAEGRIVGGNRQLAGLGIGTGIGHGSDLGNGIGGFLQL